MKNRDKIICQSVLNERFNFFLKEVGDENLDRFAGGICNGYTFQNYLHTVKETKNINAGRLYKFSKMTYKTLQKRASAYREYKTLYRFLATTLDDKEDISIFNIKLTELSDKLLELRNNFEANKIIIQALELEVRVLRENREIAINNKIQEKLVPTKYKLKLSADNIYYYIHSLISTQNPKDLGITDEKRSLNQGNYKEMVELFYSDTLPSHVELKDILKFAFIFTVPGLVNFLGNKIVKDLFRDGDFIINGTKTHASSFRRKNGQLELYDPALIKLKPYSLEETVNLAFRIKTLKASGTFYGYLYVDFMVCVTKTEKNKKPLPTRLQIVQSLLEYYGDDFNINTKTFDNLNLGSIMAICGYADILPILAEKKFDFTVFVNGYNIAEYAAIYGHENVIKKLLELKESLKLPSNYFVRALRFGCKNGNLDVVETLLDAKGLANYFNPKGQSPLTDAILNNHESTVKFLLDSKAVNAKTVSKDKQTALHCAAKIGNPRVIKLLLENKAKTNLLDKNGRSPVYLAAKLGHAYVLELLLQAEPYKYERDLPLTDAIRNNSVKVVTTIIDQKSININKIDANKQTSLHIAAQEGNTDIFKILLEKKANPTLLDDQGQTSISIALQYGHIDLITYFFKSSFVTGMPVTCISIKEAVTNNHIDVVKFILDLNILKDYQQEEGTSFLSIISENGYADMLNVFIEKKIDLNFPNKKGETPVITAAINNKPEIIKILSENKAELEKPDIHGSTPLHHAAKNNAYAAVKMLLTQGVNPILLDHNGNSVLYFSDESMQSFIILRILKNYLLNNQHVAENKKLLSDQTLLMKEEAAKGLWGNWAGALETLTTKASGKNQFIFFKEKTQKTPIQILSTLVKFKRTSWRSVR